VSSGGTLQLEVGTIHSYVSAGAFQFWAPWSALTGKVGWCLTALSAQTGYIVPYKYEIHYVEPEDKTNTQ